MDKEAINLLIRKHPQLKGARAKLEAMKPGAYCINRSWGMGQIKAYDEKEQKLIIDFEDEKTGHAMDPVFCVDKLDVLPDDNILVRQREDPQAVEELIKKNPTDLIAEILAHCPENSATESELEHVLRRVLGKARYKKWWGATKKALVKDSRIASPSKKTLPFILRDEPIKIEELILDEFFETKAPKKKIALAAKLLALSVKHEDIKEALPDILKSLASSLQETKQLSQSERLEGIWVRNDLARFIQEDVEQLLPTSASIIKESMDLSELAAKISAVHFKRFLNLIERCYAQEWKPVHYSLLKNSSAKFTTECVNYLMDKGCTDEMAANLQRWLEEQSLKAPLIFWILKNRHSRKYAKIVQPLIGPKLLHATFLAIDHEVLQHATVRRVPLADLLGDDPVLVVELLSEASPENARDLATSLILNQGFEDLSKKSLLARFIKLFPGIQTLVSGDAAPEHARLIVSKDSFQQRRTEYDDLVKVRIPENKKALAHARELGDLNENAEYKMARQEQDMLLARKSQLDIDLSRAQITDFSNAPTEVVGIGSVVKLIQKSSGADANYSILGAWDSKPEENILSYLTPLAKAIIGKKVGDTVKVQIGKNAEEWTIQAISRWLDKA